ncbi:NADPH-dependent FMN reductase [Bosea sp. BH3]|uniref:NADPH-dependent FMN reductase n=1 Tax=Bosea sp. BH3 TaxID=2871701 RepID=UPI0021CB29B0|nr:NADPH-dependent FMN reductase [Bosea sp. BH3]MCU4180900.1 NAD(P)H-dependent oxidoreductase [Bosea sp. BH3]
MAKLKLAIVVGSTRRESINLKLAEALAKLGADAFEPSFVRIDDLPLFNQDLEADRPESTLRLKREIEAADAILIVTPEHNRSITAALKNAIDWASRPYGKNSWAGKLVAVTGTSGGAIGSAVAQQNLRMIMTNLAGVVVGGQVFITYKEGLIDGAHEVTDEGTRKFLQGFIDNFATIAGKLAG